eukprot:scaffold1246_cov134-Cylindrotheca_fusiformis.AAC.18
MGEAVKSCVLSFSIVASEKSGAWAKGASSAVASAPPKGRFEDVGGDGRGGSARGGGGHNRRGNQNNPNHRGPEHSNRRWGKNSTDGRGGGGRGGRDGGGRGGRDGGGNRGRGGRGGRNNRNGGGHGNVQRIVHKDVQLLNENGCGKTKEQQRVRRFPARELMRHRLDYLEVTDAVRFTPHKECHWTDKNRIEVIQGSSMKAIELGDVSQGKGKPETAPPIEECAPLEVNEETRWKSRAMEKKAVLDEEDEVEPPQTTEAILGRVRLILNKISLTTLDRLMPSFIETGQVETNEEVRKEVIHLLIQKSQREHHFGPMYAELCARIAKKIKPFKKELLEQCQKEFEIDTAHKIAQATEGITDKDEIEYHSLLIRKSYVGHIKFLGELYKRDVVKLAVMTYCLNELIKDEEDEENLECFAHLMTTMGEKLDVHAKQNNKPFDWDDVVQLRNSKKISNRIRFLLQDLLDLKDNGWVSRRKKESAVNLHELHKEIAEEEASKSGKQNRRVSSSQNLRRSSSVSSVPVVDDDGFVEISRSSMKTSSSKLDMATLNENSSSGGAPPPVPPPVPTKKAEMRRSQSQPASMSNSKKEKPALSPDKCSEKAQSMLKEFFVGGDTADSVLTIEELVQASSDGAFERGAKIVEGGVLLVMEMKREQAEKCALVYCRAFKEGKLPARSVVDGLSAPLEFLRDIEIDAPLAGSHLAYIVAEFAKVKAVEVDKLLNGAPAYFKTDGAPALFCSKVLKSIGREPSDADFELVASLMTEDDKSKYSSAKALYDSA